MEAVLKIHEIFFSIQGESLLAGKPTVFVRTAACNLRCHWCDSKHAFWHGSPMSLEAILAEVQKHKTPYVCLTGGEPLGQRGIYPLMDQLLALGKIVSLETNGSFSVEEVPAPVIKVIDIKCPGSGEVDANHWANVDLAAPHDQFKFVIASKEDFEWAKAICDQHDLFAKCAVLFSPVHGSVSPLDLATWVLDAEVPVTLQVQMHKVIWPPDTRGV